MRFNRIFIAGLLLFGLVTVSESVFADDHSAVLDTAITAEESDPADRLVAIESAPFSALGVLGKGVGLGLAIMGAGRGIGAIGSHTVDAIARQPEAAGPIGQNGLILAALIEGATLFAIIAFSFLF